MRLHVWRVESKRNTNVDLKLEINYPPYYPICCLGKTPESTQGNSVAIHKHISHQNNTPVFENLKSLERSALGTVTCIPCNLRMKYNTRGCKSVLKDHCKGTKHVKEVKRVMENRRVDERQEQRAVGEDNQVPRQRALQDVVPKRVPFCDRKANAEVMCFMVITVLW